MLSIIVTGEFTILSVMIIVILKLSLDISKIVDFLKNLEFKIKCYFLILCVRALMSMGDLDQDN